jgi:hypothetical protein
VGAVHFDSNYENDLVSSADICLDNLFFPVTVDLYSAFGRDSGIDAK